jgi:hypothetical protein
MTGFELSEGGALASFTTQISRRQEFCQGSIKRSGIGRPVNRQPRAVHDRLSRAEYFAVESMVCISEILFFPGNSL